MQPWFEKFRFEDFKVEDAPRGDRPTAIKDGDLKAFLEVNPSQTVHKIAESLGVTKTAKTYMASEKMC